VSKPPLTAREGVEILDRALVLGLRHFWLLLALELPPFTAYAVLVRVYANYSLPAALRWSAYVLALATTGAIQAILAVGVWDLVHGRPVSFLAAWLRVLRRIVGVGVAQLLKFIFTILAVILLVIPALYVFAYWFAVPLVNVIEDLGIRASVRRSSFLAGGAVAPIWLSVGLVYLVILLLNYGILFGAVRLGMHRGSTPQVLASFLVDACAYPFRATAGVLVYLELRKRKEAYDLEGLLAALPARAAAL